MNWLPKSVFIFLFMAFLGTGTYIVLRHFQNHFKLYAYFLCLSLLPLGFLILQVQIQSQVYATVTGKSPISIHTSNNKKAPEIGSLKVGDAFQIIEPESKNTKGWFAITTSNIPLGWIKADSYIVYRGKIDPKESKN